VTVDQTTRYLDILERQTRVLETIAEYLAKLANPQVVLPEPIPPPHPPRQAVAPARKVSA
jgi:hypothetical protein